MQDRREVPPEIEANLRAVGNEPRPDNLDPAAPKIQLTEVEAKESDLKTLIERTVLEDAAKQKLLGLLDEEIRLKRQSSLEALDEKTPQTLFSPHFKSLKDYQDNTRKVFTKDLPKGDDSTRDIEAALLAMHESSTKLLNQSLNKKNEDDELAAYNNFRRRFPLDENGNVVSVAQNPLPGTYNLMKELEGKNPPSLKNGKNKYIHVSGNTLTSDDPKALGYAMASSGFKRAEFSGTPQNAIKAAKAALISGVETVALDQATLEKLNNPRSFSSPRQYVHYQKEWEALTNIMHAKSVTRKTKENAVFNQSPDLSPQAQEFNLISANQPGHRQMLKGMNEKERAQLAYELRDQQFDVGDKHYNGHEYIRQFVKEFDSLLTGYGGQVAFDFEYNRIAATRILEKVEKAADPQGKAQALLGENHHTRMALFSKMAVDLDVKTILVEQLINQQKLVEQNAPMLSNFTHPRGNFEKELRAVLSRCEENELTTIMEGINYEKHSPLKETVRKAFESTNKYNYADDKADRKFWNDIEKELDVDRAADTILTTYTPEIRMRIYEKIDQLDVDHASALRAAIILKILQERQEYEKNNPILSKFDQGDFEKEIEHGVLEGVDVYSDDALGSYLTRIASSIQDENSPAFVKFKNILSKKGIEFDENAVELSDESQDDDLDPDGNIFPRRR